MRVKHTVRPVISKDTAGKIILFDPDATLSEVVLDGFTKMTSGVFSVATSANEALALGDITAVRGIYVEADADFNLTLNGGSALSMKVGKTGGTAKGLLEATISAINVANPSGTAVLNGLYVLWGDPAA